MCAGRASGIRITPQPKLNGCRNTAIQLDFLDGIGENRGHKGANGAGTPPPPDQDGGSSSTMISDNYTTTLPQLHPLGSVRPTHKIGPLTAPLRPLRKTPLWCSWPICALVSLNLNTTLVDRACRSQIWFIRGRPCNRLSCRCMKASNGTRPKAAMPWAARQDHRMRGSGSFSSYG